MFYKGEGVGAAAGYVIFNCSCYSQDSLQAFSRWIGVGHLVLCQIEGVDHVFSNHHIFKCSGPLPRPPPPPPSTLYILTSLLKAEFRPLAFIIKNWVIV